MAEEKKSGYDCDETYSDDSDAYQECIIEPGNDRRKIICDSPNRNDAIVQCIGSLETEYKPDKKLKKTEKTHGTGTVIHCDATNKIYILTVAHNVRANERECKKCKTKTLHKICPKQNCNGSTKQTKKLVKPKKIYFSRRGTKSDSNLGECIEVYQAKKHEIPKLYENFPKSYNGFDICIIICQCSKADNVSFYKQNCANICLANDTSFGGKASPLYIYGYPYDKREKKNFRTYYYMFGHGAGDNDDDSDDDSDDDKSEDSIQERPCFTINWSAGSDKLIIINTGIDTSFGQSGSILYSYNGGDESSFLIYGVHSGGSATRKLNFATFLDNATLRWIQNIFAANNVQNVSGKLKMGTMDYTFRRIKDWTNEDTVKWMQTVRLPVKWQALMVQTIRDCGRKGVDLVTSETAKDIGELFGIKNPMLYNRVFKAIKQAQQKENDKIFSSICISRKPKQERKRWIQFKKYGLIKSKKSDCLTGYNEEDLIDRAEIGCGEKHAMAAETMYNYIAAVLQKNSTLTNIPCPHCKTPLDWNKCTQIADMTPSEYAKWTQVLQSHEFHLQLYGQGRKCALQKVTGDTTIFRVKELYKMETGIRTNIEDIVVSFKGYKLQSDRTLAALGIDKNSFLVMIHRIYGN